MKTPDLLVTSENTDPFESDQSILPDSDSKEKRDQSGESCLANYKNNQTEMIIPTPEGTLRLFLYRNIYEFYCNFYSLIKSFNEMKVNIILTDGINQSLSFQKP